MTLFLPYALRKAMTPCTARHARLRTTRSPVALATTAFCALLACVTPLGAYAVTLDDALACNDQAHAYIASLQERHLIADHSMHVEEDGLNVFSPAREAKLTAFNMRVFFVLGYQQGDPMFKPGKGEPMDGSLYGVVVNAEPATVAKAVAAAGSPAEYKHAGPFLTALYCRIH